MLHSLVQNLKSNVNFLFSKRRYICYDDILRSRLNDDILSDDIIS
jgi:hypothetical protein